MGNLIRTLIGASVLSLVMATAGAARAAEPAGCSLGSKYMVRSVTPYVTSEDAGYTSWQQFRGADVFVPAQPGLTSEWLQRVVTFEIAAGECDFGTRNVTVSALSAGSGFSLRIAGWNDRAAGEILRHARELVK
jgi:hypothetical protein